MKKTFLDEMSFRDRLLAALQALEPIFTEPGVLVIGSDMPDPRPQRARVAELLRRLESRQDSSDD